MYRELKKIVIMGLGYIGLPTASMLATKGHRVVGVDINEKVVDLINQGDIHIAEPDLDILVRSAVNSGNLRASLTPEEADIFILAVPTPFKNTSENPKTPDLSFVEAATRNIASYLKPGNLVIIESTSPVGTTQRIQRVLFDMRPDIFGSEAEKTKKETIYIAYCPERVLPGKIIHELVDNDRIIGGINRISAEKAKALYKTFCNGNIFLTDAKTAEMAKLAENSFRDVNIAFANELSIICDKLGINVWELIELSNKHPRVNILRPGPGVGGHCIAVDPWFIVANAPNEARLIKIAREVNDSKPNWVLNKIYAESKKFEDPVIGCLGLSFKANVDDFRESPALEITRKLIKSGIGKVIACEPNFPEDMMEDIPLYPLSTVVEQANILVILVDHDEFYSISTYNLENKIVLDTRGISGIINNRL